MPYFILYYYIYMILYYFVLYYIKLNYIISYHIISYHIIVYYCIVFNCIVFYFIVLYCIYIYITYCMYNIYIYMYTYYLLGKSEFISIITCLKRTKINNTKKCFQKTTAGFRIPPLSMSPGRPSHPRCLHRGTPDTVHHFDPQQVDPKTQINSPKRNQNKETI